ncbi:MAG: sensor histidine kinase [Firmicutes bacterium]|nr:sensor histidine kinase [Bacillota bacterium]
MWEQLKQKYLKFLLKQSMRNIIYAIIVILTLGVAGFVGVFVSRNHKEEQKQTVVEDNQELAEQINVSMSQYIHSMMRLSDTLYYDIIKNEEGQMEPMFQAMYDGYKDYVESIALFRRDGTLLQVKPALSVEASQDVTQEEWFTQAFERSENIHFFPPQIQDCFEKDTGFPWVIPMSRFVQISEGNFVKEGVLLINIKYSAMSEIFRNNNPSPERYAFLMDGSGRLIYHPRHALINSGFMEAPPASLAAYKDGSYETEISGDAVFCCIKTVGYTGWKIVSVISQERVQSYRVKSTFFMLAVICQVLLFFMIVGYYLSAVLTNPIRNLEEDVKKISEGDLDLKVHTSGSFEVYHLGRSIQKMSVKIRQLMQEVIREQEEKRKSELDSLQAQITPHFLYNTLDIVVWMIEEDRKEDAAQIVTSLARLLRISLSKGKNIITVSDELEHVRNYLTIQSLRAKDQFTWRIEKEKGVDCLAVIKLIVQPIVENAIYHGMEGMYGDGEIVIHAYREEDDLYISVKDNGMGMTQEQAEALLDYTREVKTAKGNGLGVRNVHERIRLHFGEGYGIKIISEVDEGTEVLLHLPAVMYGEHEKWAE